MRRPSGFTLIELLVVLVIIGIAVGSVTLAVGGSGDRALEHAARRAQARIGLACERAVLGGHDLGFSLVDGALRFGYLRPQGWQPFGPSEGDELRERPLGDGLRLELRREGETLGPDDGRSPQLACYSSGELTAFELILARDDVERHWRLRGQLDGKLLLEPIDEAGG